MTFKDLNNFKASGYYIVPNEDTVVWRNLVKGLRVDRAAAICSSGEVGLIAMLPTVRKELVLIDHSYASLSVAMLKYAMLRELGATETRRLLTTTAGTREDLEKNIQSFLKKLPKEVVGAYERFVDRAGSWEGGFLRETAQPRVDYKAKIDPNTGYYPVIEEPPRALNNKLKREWDRLPHRDVLRSVAKLDKVTFLHGDLHDLAEQGQFDLLYLSNALEHSGRNGAPSVKQVVACMKPGGYVIVAHRGDPCLPALTTYSHRALGVKPDNTQDPKWEVVATEKVTTNMGWQQTLYRLPVEQEVAA